MIYICVLYLKYLETYLETLHSHFQPNCHFKVFKNSGSACYIYMWNSNLADHYILYTDLSLNTGRLSMNKVAYKVTNVNVAIKRVYRGCCKKTTVSLADKFFLVENLSWLRRDLMQTFKLACGRNSYEKRCGSALQTVYCQVQYRFNISLTKNSDSLRRKRQPVVFIESYQRVQYKIILDGHGLISSHRSEQRI
jgi:hypothetical protein